MKLDFTRVYRNEPVCTSGVDGGFSSPFASRPQGHVAANVYCANGEGRLIVGFAFLRRFLYLNHEAPASTDSRSEMPVR